MDTLEWIVKIVLVLGSVFALLLAWGINKGNNTLRNARLSHPSREGTEDDQACPKGPSS